MVTIIKRGSSKNEIKKKLAQIESKKLPKRTNIAKFVGSIKLKEDPLKLQKQLRDEWE
jgi:hypothetical protein